MPAARHSHQETKFLFTTKVRQERVPDEIRIRKEAAHYAIPQNAQGRRAILQQRVCLRNLVNCLGIADAVLIDLAFHRTQDVDALLMLAPNAVTQSFANLRMQHGTIQLKSAIEIDCRALPFVIIVFTESAIEDDQRYVVILGETLKELINLAKIEISV